MQAILKGEDKALDQGVLSYPRLGSLTIGKGKLLDITVVDIGKRPHATLSVLEASRRSGRVIFSEDVPTGAIVGLRMTSCSSNLTCEPQTFGTRVAIPGRGSSATWSWKLTAHSPGPASVGISAATYAGTSSVILRTELVTINVQVPTTSAFERAQSARRRSHDVSNTVGLIGKTFALIVAAFTAIGALASGFLAIFRWLRRSKEKRKEKKAVVAARAEARRREQEKKQEQQEIARQKQEERERQKQDPAWQKPT